MSTDNLEYDSPRTFTRKQKTILAIGPPVVAGAFKLIDATCKHVARGQHHWDNLANSGQHFLSGIWHENLIAFLCIKRNSGMHTLTSYSFDGEIAARASRQFGLEALRGSSSEGGMKALVQMSMAIKQIPMIGTTLDGPKGPRRKAKPGMAMLALRAQIPILPMAATLTRCRRLDSWDRLALPVPFSTMVVSYGDPIPPPADRTKKAILETTEALEISMNTLQREIEEEFGVDPLLPDGLAT